MLEFRSCPLDEQPAAALVQGMREEMFALYGGLELDSPDMPRAGAAELGPPGGTFLVGWEDEVPVCCGGIKELPDGACEIKRMFVIEAARGGGARAAGRARAPSACTSGPATRRS